MSYIQIENINGTPPFQVYVCDFTYTYCEYATTILSTVYLPYSFSPPINFDNVNKLIVKIIDGNGCVSFQNQECPSPTMTPTPTPTPI